MRIIFFMLLFSTCLIAQDYYVIGTAALSGITHGMSESYRIQEKDEPLSLSVKREYNKRWHILSAVSTISNIGLGLSIALNSDFKIKRLTKDLLWSLAVGVPSAQISYNLTYGYNAFRISNSTGNPFEKYLTLPTYLILIGGTLLVEIIWQ